MADYPLTAAAIKNQFKRAGIHFVVALPDRVTSHHLLKGLIADPDYTLQVQERLTMMPAGFRLSLRRR